MDVVGVFGSRQKCPHDRQRIVCGQPLGGTGKLAADLDIRLDRRAPGQGRRHGRRNT